MTAPNPYAPRAYSHDGRPLPCTRMPDGNVRVTASPADYPIKVVVHMVAQPS